MTKSYLEKKLKSKINQIIVSNLNNPRLKRDLIAKKLMVNRMFLHRKLKIFYDCNARGFILNKRIDFAKKQLTKTDLPIRLAIYCYHCILYREYFKITMNIFIVLHF
jgi:AraC-like DNA-binding protein